MASVYLMCFVFGIIRCLLEEQKHLFSQYSIFPSCNLTFLFSFTTKPRTFWMLDFRKQCDPSSICFYVNWRVDLSFIVKQ